MSRCRKPLPTALNVLVHMSRIQYTCAEKVMETLREEKMFDNAILLQEIEPTQTGMHAIYGYCFI